MKTVTAQVMGLLTAPDTRRRVTGEAAPVWMRPSAAAEPTQRPGARSSVSS